MDDSSPMNPTGNRPDDTPLWGRETAAALANFQISGRPMPIGVIHWLARLKSAAARVHRELGELDHDLADSVIRAADEIASGVHDDQFPVDVFQTGSGTSTNMNVNEVVANRAKQLMGQDLSSDVVHPNDHVNASQSSNDTFPTSVHVAVARTAKQDLIPALELLAGELRARSRAWEDVVKSGRTHLMDATPVTLGQEFGLSLIHI